MRERGRATEFSLLHKRGKRGGKEKEGDGEKDGCSSGQNILNCAREKGKEESRKLMSTRTHAREQGIE